MKNSLVFREMRGGLETRLSNAPYAADASRLFQSYPDLLDIYRIRAESLSEAWISYSKLVHAANH